MARNGREFLEFLECIEMAGHAGNDWMAGNGWKWMGTAINVLNGWKWI